MVVKSKKKKSQNSLIKTIIPKQTFEEKSIEEARKESIIRKLRLERDRNSPFKKREQYKLKPA